jgi:hypothetical protein
MHQCVVDGFRMAHLYALPHLPSTTLMHRIDHARTRDSERQEGCMLDVYRLPCGWAVAGYAERPLQVLDEELHLLNFAMNENCGSWLHLMHKVYYSFRICV